MHNKLVTASSLCAITHTTDSSPEVSILFESSPDLNKAKECIDELFHNALNGQHAYIELLQNVAARSDDLGSYTQDSLKKIFNSDNYEAAKGVRTCAQNLLLFIEKNTRWNANEGIDSLRNNENLLIAANIHLKGDGPNLNPVPEVIKDKFDVFLVKEKNLKGLNNNSGKDCFLNSAIQSMSKKQWQAVLDPARERKIINGIDEIKKQLQEKKCDQSLDDISYKKSVAKLDAELEAYRKFMLDSAPVINQWLQGEDVEPAELRKAIFGKFTFNIANSHGCAGADNESSYLDTKGNAIAQGDSREMLTKLNDVLLIKYTDGLDIITKLSSESLKNEKIISDAEYSHSLTLQIFGKNNGGEITDRYTSLSKALDVYCTPRPYEYIWEDKPTAKSEPDDTTGQTCFRSLPEIIRIDLVREKFLGNKAEHAVEIDNITLKSIKNDSKTYNCKSAVCYTGNQAEGHYYSLRMIENQWYKFNDNEITAVTEEIAFEEIAKKAVHVVMHKMA